MARGARRATSASTSGAQPLRGGLRTTTSARSMLAERARGVAGDEARVGDAVQRRRRPWRRRPRPRGPRCRSPRRRRARQRQRDAAHAAVGVDHALARAGPPARRRSPRRRARRRRGWPGRTRPATAAAAPSWPATSTRSSIVAGAVEQRSFSPSASAKMALPRDAVDVLDDADDLGAGGAKARGPARRRSAAAGATTQTASTRPSWLARSTTWRRSPVSVRSS